MANGTSRPIRMRKDVWKLDPWDPVLLWYAKAVGAMQRRAIADPTSWRYQAAIHDYDPAGDPNRTRGEVLPSVADQDRFWRKCQHGSWFFLPWHRMYLACFEQIVAAAIVELGGPADWALPYWNYSDANNPNARRLPPAFIARVMPDGTPNPLRPAGSTDRTPDDNGDIGIDDAEVSLSCLEDPLFTGVATGARPGFGGPKTIFHHDGGGPIGGLEQTPHGDIHVAVGGPDGLMSAFTTAALDPIFWLHHANIDRLWEVWRKRDERHADPTANNWLAASGATFLFHDVDGNVVSFAPSQVVDTTSSILSYQYEDTADPLAPEGALAVAPTRRAVMAEAPVPAELVGATDRPVALSATATTAHVPIRPPTGPARLAAVAPVEQRVYLNLENITGKGKPATYGVYVNLPEGIADPRQHRELFAGTLPMFGIAEASRRDEKHSGSGLTYVLDITAIVNRLKAQNAWDANKLRVTFVPRRQGAKESTIQVGRVSVYYH